MTVVRISKIGLVAHYSLAGDWAFDLAFRIVQEHQLQLNIVHFLESPYEMPQDISPAEIEVKEPEEWRLISEEKHLRLYYDQKLEDYINVGFRICTSARHNQELRRCLLRKDYQFLVIPYLDYGVTFGNMPLTEFDAQLKI